MFKKIAIATLFSAPVVYTQPIDSSFSERAKRPAKFWSKLLPVFLHYKSTQFYLNSIASKSQAEKDLVYEKLHEKYADQVLDLILDLRGIYIKIGQVGAMRADIFPETYRKRFQVLLDRVPSLDGDHAIKIVQEALGKDLTKVFSEFNENAIGAASIGQVHKAILLDGTHVVVKIKLTKFAYIASPEQLPAMNELRSQFLKEFDFEREAWALRTIRKNIMPHFSNVIIPKPIDHLCNSNVIVMEYVPGKRLLDGIIQNYTRQAIRMGTTLDDLTKGNFTTLQQIKMSSRLAFFYLFDRLQYSATFFWNNSIGLFSNSIRFVYPTLSLNTKSIYSTLLKVQAHQIFNDRIFNGDPHLGNILLTPDGKLGLIDYGQVKSISKKDAREYATLLFLIKDKSKVNELLQVAKSMGFSTEKNDNYVLEKTLRVCLDNDSIEECEGLNLQQFMEKLARQDKTKSIPEQFVFAVRASLLLRGIGHLLGYHNVSLATEWRSYALKAIERYPKGTIDDDVVYDFKKEV